MTHVMLDLETFGSRPGSVIVSVGAVRFDKDSLGEEFYRTVDPESCATAGMTMDTSSILWWLAQSEEARAGISSPTPVHISVALLAFSDFVKGGETCVWGNGATFDNVLLSEAYRMLAIPRPWSHRLDRCFRTMKFMFPATAPARVGTHHNALDDAKHQARWLQRILTTRNLPLE